MQNAMQWQDGLDLPAAFLRCVGNSIRNSWSMFFYLSKILSLFLLPFPLFYLTGLLGLLRYRARIPSKHRPSSIFLLLYLFCGFLFTDFAADRIHRSLENRSARLSVASAPPVDAAFVLGAISNPLARVDDEPQFTDGVDRLLTAVDLFRAGKVQYIILTGKSSLIDHKGMAESEELKQYLVRRGLPADRILVDTESRNTAENFTYGLKLSQERGLKQHYLITSAFHMYRSLITYEKIKEESFSSADITMTPFPVDYRSNRIESGLEAYVPSAHAAYKTSIGLKEYMGLLAYAIRGYISFERLYNDLAE